MASIVTVGAVASAVTNAPIAAADPGDPGNPGDPTVLYTEDFENNMGTDQVLLSDYIGAPPTNETYTADDVWLINCNGEIVAFNTPATELGNCTAPTSASRIRQLAYALGSLNGTDVDTNHAVAAYTEGSTAVGADAVEFQTENLIPLPSATGRFVTFSVNAAALNCTVSAPQYQFSLMDGATATPVGGVINACNGGQTVNAPAVGNVDAIATHAGTYTSNGSVLFTGSSLGLRMTNANGLNNGNDAAFDDIKVLDVTPQLDKSFSPDTVNVGGISTLTLTVTNTSELAAKDGWGFTDTLPDNLVVASTPNVGGTCDATTGATAGGSAITVTGGNLDANEASCTITVDVTSDTVGSYTNGADNISDQVGIDPPGDATVRFQPGPELTCDAFGYLFQSPNAPDAPHTVTRVDLVTGATTAIGTTADYINAVGYNTLDNYFYGWDTASDQIVRIDADLTLLPLGLPDGMPNSEYITGDFDDSGHYWITTNASPTVWAEVDFAPGSSTYGEVIDQGVISTGQASVPSDWSFIDGKLYGLRRVANDPPVHLFSFDPSTSASDDLGALVGPNGWVGAGATYTDGTYLYGSDNPTGDIYRVDPATRQTILITDNGPASSSNDGARCSAAPIPTITVTKTVASRVAPDDQFTVGLQNADGDGLTSATTSGTDTTASTTNWPVSPNAQYTITDATTNGSPNTIAAYDPTISCQTAGGDPVDATGDGPWTITSSGTEAITCDVTNAAIQQPAWTCSAFGYLFQSPNGLDDPHTITRVDLVSGQSEQVASTADELNAIGFNPLDNLVYGWDLADSQLVRIGPDGSLNGLGIPDGMAATGWNVGGFDDAGQFWMMDTTVSPRPWVELDLDTSSATFGTVVDSGVLTPTDPPSGLGAMGDWSYTNGAFYGVAVTADRTGDAHLVRLDIAEGHLIDEGPLPGVPSQGSGYGATYVDAAGYLYAADNNTGSIYRVDVTSNEAILVTADGPPSFFNDGARCSTAPIPTITVTKSVKGRVSPDDQFTVGLGNGDGDVLTSATTAGTDTTVSTTDWPVSQGSTYTITDAMAGGSANTIDRYTASISCIDGDGNTVDTEGTALAWTLDVADATDYTCTVTNALAAFDFGDAPASYGTLLADGGPLHSIPGYDEADHTAPAMLGAHIDADADGQPSARADGDDTTGVDDEDGVTFNPDLGYATPTLRTGYDASTQQPVENHLTVNASADGFVSVWVDWNEDGDFADAGEQVVSAQAVTAGDNDLTFSQADNPPGIETYVRVRYSTDADAIAAPTGAAPDGEVEDYRVQVERLIVPSTCTVGDAQHFAFTFDQFDTSGDGSAGTTARFHNVSVINGVPVDMVIEVLDGQTQRLGLGTGGTIGTDDADWQINEDATLQYAFVQAGTDTPVDVNAVFTVNDMDGPPRPQEIGTFTVSDLASYAVTDGSSVTITESGGNVSFIGHGDHNGDPGSRFQIVLEGVSTFQAHWQGGSDSGFGYDGDGDLSIQPPACSDFGDAPDTYGTTLANDGARHTVVSGVHLGDLIDFDPDGQPSDGADGDDTNRADDEDGVSFNPSLGYDTPTLQTGLDADTGQPVENHLTVNASANGFVSVWVDWNEDGDFTDDGEQVVSAQAVTAGDNDLTFSQGDNPPGIETYVRVRYSTDADAIAAPTGAAPDGEVEDYRVQVERLIVPSTCTVSDTPHYAFTFSAPVDLTGTGDVGSSARFRNVSVIDGVPVDMVVRVVAGSNNGSTENPPNGFGIGDGTDDASWHVQSDATLEYTFVQAGTDTPVPVNAVFTVNDMDGPPVQQEIATFTAADLAGYAVSEGSSVTIAQSGGDVSFTGHGDHDSDPGSRFQIVVEGISSFQARWQGSGNSGFSFDGDNDLSIQPACSDFGDAPDSYGTTLANDGARATMVPGLTLGASVDFDPDGQPTDAADGDDTNRTDDEDGVAAPIEIQTGVPTTVPVSVTNTTDNPATLAAWIDLNYNGTFDAGELQQVSVPANSGTADYPLTWPAQDPPGDPTYARFRLLSGDVADPSPTGDWPDGGEVEDYLVQSRALSIEKTSDATAATRMGDTVHYTVTAKNIGGADFTADHPAEVIDDLTDVLDDASFDGTVQVTGSDVDATYSEPQIHWSGPLASGDSVTLDYDVVLNKAGDQDVANVAFQPPPCDSGQCTPPTPPDPADCAANDGLDPATDLPCDGTDLLLPRLTIDKSSPDLATAQIGDTVHYSITATNTGQADYTAGDPAEMVDDLGNVLDDATYNQDAAISDNGPGAVSYTEPQITWTGPLAVGDEVTVTYSVTITGNGDLQVDNVAFEAPACTTGDCPQPTPPDPGDCAANNGVDPATGFSCDETGGGLPKLTITKTAPNIGQARIGDAITWTVTATNVGTRDYTADAPASVVDDLTGVLDDATVDPGSITTKGSDIDATYTEPQIGWAGPLAQSDTVTITYTTVLTGAGDGQVDNVAWQLPPGPNPPCELGSCAPPDPDDCAATGTNPDTGLPCVPVEQPLPRPEITKTASPTDAHIGDVVTYKVTLTNVGPGDYTAKRPGQVADDLSGVLDDATFDGTVTTKGSDINATYSKPQILWSGPLAAGDTVTLTYRVRYTGDGDGHATNVAYVPPAPPACDETDATDCPPPPDPTPPDPSGCTDGADSSTGLPCVPVTEDLPKLKLEKSSPDLAAAHIGDDVTFTVTAKNVGERDFSADDPALVIDDLSGVLDDASFDGTVTVDGSDIGATYAEPRITWSGPLAQGDTVTLTYTVHLTGAGDLQVDNVAFVPPSPPVCDPDGECPPYDPPTPDPTTCASNHNVDPATGLPCMPVTEPLPKLELEKSSPNLATASIGDDVVFTVTATNVGERDFGKDDPALVIDDLSGVLDDATFNGKVRVDGSTVKASYDKPRITWTGPLAMGDTVTLTYTVHLTGDGDLSVDNVAFVPPPPPVCDPDDECPPYDPPTPDPETCASNHNVDPATGLPCAPVSQDLRKLQIVKSSDAAGVVRDGDTVTYTVTATNLGPADYTADQPATVVDDLSAALDDARYNGDAAADVDGDLSYAKGQLSWVGALPTGTSVTITYTVTVTGQGDLDLVNVAFTPPPLDQDCAGSGTCPTPDPKDCVAGADAVTGQPCAVTETPLPGLYVTKQVDKTSADAGDTLSFTVTMTNTGNVDFTAADPAVLTDDLTGVLDDAAYHGDAAADLDGDLAYADQTLTWTGPLAVGDTVTVTYTVTVNDDKTGDDQLDNVASIPDGITPRYPGGECPDGAASCDPPSPQAITVSAVNRAASPPLSYTGNDTAGQMGLALVLLVLGVGLVMIGRRRGWRAVTGHGRRDGRMS